MTLKSTYLDVLKAVFEQNVVLWNNVKETDIPKLFEKQKKEIKDISYWEYMVSLSLFVKAPNLSKKMIEKIQVGMIY